MDIEHKLNIYRDGDLQFSWVYPSYAAMLDDARRQRDNVELGGGFVVAQCQRKIDKHTDWAHVAILT
jgi:hypothetical protein